MKFLLFGLIEIRAGDARIERPAIMNNRLARPLLEAVAQDRACLEHDALGAGNIDIDERALEVRAVFTYQKWIPSDEEGTGGTLLWEAAKHIGEPLDCTTNPIFLVLFASNFLDRLLNEAMVYELLTGKVQITPRGHK